MSRVLFVALDENKVTTRCKAEDVEISVLEALPAGGVRLVCNSGAGAALMSRKLKRHLISGKVSRAPRRPKRSMR